MAGFDIQILKEETKRRSNETPSRFSYNRWASRMTVNRIRFDHPAKPQPT